MATIGLGIICKDEVEDIERILKDYGSIFDEIQITVTSPTKKEELFAIIQKYNGTPSYFEWCNDFAAARNFNKAQFKKAEVYWTFDCDDSIENPEQIRKLSDYAEENNVAIIYCKYNYSRDADGNVNAFHNKERMIKLDDNYYWNKRIHENVLVKNRSNHKMFVDASLIVNHRMNDEKAMASAIRNIQYLLEEYNQDKEKTDPRTIAYLGRMFLSVKDFDKAIFFLERHIDKSGWDEDRYMSWCQLAEGYRQTKQLDKAISCCMEALVERPDYPDAYLKLHDIYCDREEWKKAILWGEAGLKHPTPETFMMVDPSSYTWRPAMSLAYCYFMCGNLTKAKPLFDYAKKLAPSCEFIKSNSKLFDNAWEHAQYVDKFMWLAMFTKDKEINKLKPLLDAVPKELQDHELLLKLRYSYLPPKVWPDRSIAILAPSEVEYWSPLSVSKGIGGSEEAVIYLGQELQKLGYSVTVYNYCGEEEGEYNGVRYINHYKFNPRDHFDILVSWRSNVFTYAPINANQKWIWMHDVPSPEFFQEGDEKSFDKVIVLSNYHKSLLPKYIPEDKILVSANGINLNDFQGVQVERNPHRAIYGSSYVRGVEHLLKMWPRIRHQVPDAELHIYYGWESADKIEKGSQEYEKFKKYLLKLLEQPGVFEHGRIGHKELIQEFYKSGVWAYPCHFPEISCITAMKAQICGAVPVSTEYAALAETVQSGIKVPGDIRNLEVQKLYEKELIWLLKDTERQERLRKEAIEVGKQFSWAKVALQWHNEFDKQYVKTEVPIG